MLDDFMLLWPPGEWSDEADSKSAVRDKAVENPRPYFAFSKGTSLKQYTALIDEMSDA